MKAKAIGLTFLISFVALGCLIARAPLAVAALSVACFAAPHNWMEARYILGRLPGKLGKLRTYFLTSVLGIGFLGITSFVLPFISSPFTYSLWNSLLVIWVTRLAYLRSQEHPKKRWPWLEPTALFILAVIWAYPTIFTLTLVLGHPILAVIILGRELAAFRRPELSYYKLFVLAVSIGLLCLLGSFWGQGLSGNNEIHSFMVVVTDTPLFIAVHTYLELVHYLVWIVLLPWLAWMTGRSSLSVMPALRKSVVRLWGARIVLLGGAFLGVLIWWGFQVDYRLTYELYFQLAIFHVLIEFPFALRTA